MKYLIIINTRSPENFVKLNLEPLIATLKSKMQTWAKLPLGVIGSGKFDKDGPASQVSIHIMARSGVFTP